MNLKSLHLETSKRNRIAVTSEPDKPFRLVESFGSILDLASVKLINVDIQNLGAIKCDFYRLPLDLDLLKVPLACRSQIPMFGTDAVVERAVILIRFQVSFGVLRIVAIAVNDLDFKPVG